MIEPARSLLSDKEIGKLCMGATRPMIEPFFNQSIRFDEDGQKINSYGLSSYGYDVRLDNNVDHIRIFSNVKVTEINPKKMTEDNFYQPTVLVDEDGGEYVLIPPHSYLQAPTVEYFDIPRDIMVVVLGKSTYARSGVVCNVTPIEPGFQGNVVIELANVTSSHVRCYLNEGVAQFLFFQGNESCRGLCS